GGKSGKPTNHVGGGIYANATATAGGVPDPIDPNKHRLDGSLNDPFSIFHATGQVWDGAKIVAGFHTFLGDITLFSITLAHNVLLDFDSDVQPQFSEPNPGETNVLRIHKDA